MERNGKLFTQPDHENVSALNTLESLETLEEHDKSKKLVDQATLEYIDNEFAKINSSDDDLSSYLL